MCKLNRKDIEKDRKKIKIDNTISTLKSKSSHNRGPNLDSFAHPTCNQPTYYRPIYIVPCFEKALHQSSCQQGHIIDQKS